MDSEKIIRELTQVSTKLHGMHFDINEVKDDIGEVKSLIREQNGRIRKNETSIARINGIGGMFILIFSTILSYFKIK